MKITKRQLRKIIKEASSYPEAEEEWKRASSAVSQIGVVTERIQERLHKAGITDRTDAPLLQDLDLILKLVDLYIEGQEIPRLI